MSRIAIIEDNVATAETLRALLDLYGFEARVAVDGPGGVELATSWRPDAVLCDIGLPGYDGFEVARRLRQQPATERTLLVAVTAYGGADFRRRGEEVGFNHYLVKPVPPDELLRVLPEGGAGRE